LSDTTTISVVTPAHDDATTLPVALASLLAQSTDDWECIVVDDGSTDRPRPAEVVEIFDDDRLRTIEFSENLGRSRARQAGLDAARGEFLCMLDADDWYLPSKLERQLAVARDHRDCVVVSTDTYLASRGGELRAVGRTRPEDATETEGERPVSIGTWNEWGRPPISHGTSMIRMRAARRGRYDSDLTRTEDMDFLLQTALGERYALLREPLYVYTRPAREDRPARMFESIRNELRICRKSALDHPRRAARLAAELLGKYAAYKMIFGLGVDPLAVRSQHREPIDAERRIFERARREVRLELPERIR
jgi:glycosyltransferase involved in cell wall biosynthesis